MPAATIREDKAQSQKSLASISFPQMPVMLARGISDDINININININIHNVSNYTTMIMHDGTSCISISLAE
jgi:hypothetical protein